MFSWGHPDHTLCSATPEPPDGRVFNADVAGKYGVSLFAAVVTAAAAAAAASRGAVEAAPSLQKREYMTDCCDSDLDPADTIDWRSGASCKTHSEL